jgi:hypothetical protein
VISDGKLKIGPLQVLKHGPRLSPATLKPAWRPSCGSLVLVDQAAEDTARRCRGPAIGIGSAHPARTVRIHLRPGPGPRSPSPGSASPGTL